MTTADTIAREIARLREAYQLKLDKLVDQNQDHSQDTTDWKLELHKSYIQNILPKVIELMLSQGSASSPSVERADLLVLGLGMTFEPLLLSIAYWQPKRILLVRNRDYGLNGQTVSARFRQRVDMLRQKVALDELGKLFHTDCVLQHDDPAQVFADLCGLDRGVPGAIAKIQYDRGIEKPRVVLDITGGKKSMVSGAFLFAAYMPGIQIAYVDFREYDPIRNRPLDETCFVREFKNPYDVFRLRDWEQVQRAYVSYQFDNALRVLNLIAQTAKASLSADSEENCCIPVLRKTLETYHAWNSGNLREAKVRLDELEKIKDELKARMPTVIETLHEDWPDEEQLKGKAKKSIDLRKVHDKAALYAKDELAKLMRIVQFSDDYRSVFVRAYGVHELLIEIRIGPSELSKCKGNRNELALLKDKNAADLLKKVGMPSTFSKEWFRDMRNKLVHVHYSVPRHFAEEALKIANANFEDFQSDWLANNNQADVKAKLDDMKCEAIPWDELLGMIGLNSLKLIDFTPDKRSNP